MGAGGPPASGAARRVLMTADAVGGVWTYALELARGLAAAGTEVVLATMGPAPSPAQRTEAAAVPGLTLAVSAFKLEWMESPWSDVDAAGEWLLGLARLHDVELVHLNGYAHGALPFRAPKLVVAHSCVFSWWAAVRGGAPPRSWQPYRQRVADGLAGADLVVAPTRWMLRELPRHYPGAERAPARAIANGRTAAALASQPKEPFVLAAGRLWDDGKNVVTLARAAAALCWPVLLAGDTAAPEATAEAAPVAWPNTRFLGALSPAQMASAYGRASIYALPARYEPFGLSVLEAALSGCALVLGDIASLRELWDDAALFVPPDDGDALAAALAALIANPTARAELAARARRRAGRYAASRMVEQYRAAYGALLGAAAALPAGRRAQVDAGEVSA